MRILVTGSQGWLGRHLVPRLRADGHEVTGLDVAAPAATIVRPGGPVASAGADFVGSVADRPLVDRVFAARGIEAVVHAAALHKPDIARYPAQAFVDVNVTGTLNLLEAAAGTRAFVFTSSTSLMISESIRAAEGDRAAWITEDLAPLEPRNIYGVTKLAAEQLCRLHAAAGLPVVVLRTGRFFPEDDDTLPGDGRNLKANEFLHRRLTVEDAAEAHVVALDRAAAIGFGTFIVSAPTLFSPADAADLLADAPSVIARHHPRAAALYERRGWCLPTRIDRVYDASRAERVLGFRARTDFTAILDALERGEEPPVVHDPGYVSPKESKATT